MRINILGYYFWGLTISLTSRILPASSHGLTSIVFDLITELSLEKHEDQNESGNDNNSLNFILELMKCSFREVTLPSVEVIRRVGPYSFSRQLLTDVFTSIGKNFELLPPKYLVPFDNDEFAVIERRFKTCLVFTSEREASSTSKNSTKDNKEVFRLQGRDYGGGGHYGGYGGGGGHKGSSIGFALLGLKIVGALIAFLIYSLLNQTG